MKKALIFWGGWDGHEPKQVAKRFSKILKGEGFEVEVVKGADKIPGLDALNELDLLVPICTGSELPREASQNIAKAVGAGLGLAGNHGGMCDAFRNDTEWQFITGGQWVSHPGGDKVEYTVNIARGSSPIVEGLEDFPVKSEHYYLHVDPAIEMLASTRFPLVNFYHASNKPIDMPVIWTKYWGVGRVFYNALGHVDSVFDQSPTAQELMRRGMLWAAEGRAWAQANGWDYNQYLNEGKMY